MSALSLATWQIAPTSAGEVQIGAMTLPAFAAIDLATRILEAADNIPEAVASRIRVRKHLDWMFRGATIVRMRWMLDGSYLNRPAILIGDRMHVRISDRMSACLLPRNGRGYGFAMEWTDDGFFGPKAAMAAGFFRVSARWILPNVLEGACSS